MTNRRRVIFKKPSQRRTQTSVTWTVLPCVLFYVIRKPTKLALCILSKPTIINYLAAALRVTKITNQPCSTRFWKKHRMQGLDSRRRISRYLCRQPDRRPRGSQRWRRLRDPRVFHTSGFSVDDAIRAMTEVQPGMNFIKERNLFFVETYGLADGSECIGWDAMQVQQFSLHVRAGKGVAG